MIETGATVSERLLSGGILELGNAKAKVSMLLFTNYSCAYCQEFHRNLLPRLLNQYVVNGKLKIGIIPLMMEKYPKENLSALTMFCAAKQGKGQALNDLLFSESDIKTAPKKIDVIGLDRDALKTCIASDVPNMLLNQAQALAASKQITLAPSYIINDKIYTGLPEWADVKGQVAEAMK